MTFVVTYHYRPQHARSECSFHHSGITKGVFIDLLGMETPDKIRLQTQKRRCQRGPLSCACSPNPPRPSLTPSPAFESLAGLPARVGDLLSGPWLLAEAVSTSHLALWFSASYSAFLKPAQLLWEAWWSLEPAIFLFSGP